MRLPSKTSALPLLVVGGGAGRLALTLPKKFQDILTGSVKKA